MSNYCVEDKSVGEYIEMVSGPVLVDKICSNQAVNTLETSETEVSAPN